MLAKKHIKVHILKNRTSDNIIIAQIRDPIKEINSKRINQEPIHPIKFIIFHQDIKTIILNLGKNKTHAHDGLLNIVGNKKVIL